MGVIRHLIGTSTSAALLSFLGASAVGCGSSDSAGAPDAGADQVTYYQDLKPLIDAKCARCHLEGGIAPFVLTDYAGASGHAGVAKAAINAGTMPPWLAADGCNDYYADFSLTDAEKNLFNRWVDGGALEGNPADVGDPVAVEEQILSRVDLEIEMQEPYTATKSPDDYRCFLVDWPAEFTTTKYVTGFNVIPGNDKVVHHVIAFLASPDQKQEYVQKDADEAGPGYTCFGGTGGPAQTWVGAWAPGSQGSDFVEGTGMAIEPGSMIILQVHYNVLENAPEPDMSKIQLKIDDAVDTVGAMQPWANPLWLQGGMQIPANDAEVTHEWDFDPTNFLSGGKPFDMHTVTFHMHQLGKSGRVSIKRANGNEECLLQIDRWDFDWQSAYEFRNKVTFNPGDQIHLECTYDNSAENQAIINGERVLPRDVNWGEGTQDEMCLSGFYWTPTP